MGERNNRAWRQALRTAGIDEGFRVHDARHTVSTFLAQGKVEPTLRSIILAHAVRKNDMSANYTHFAWSDVLEAVDRLPKLV